MVVPVPPQPRRRRARGFDPAGALAAGFARAAGATAARPRSCAATARGARSRAGRAARRAAGRIDVVAVGAVAGRVLLVDDVHTTGATLDACARALVAAGAGPVVAVTYARTL